MTSEKIKIIFYLFVAGITCILLFEFFLHQYNPNSSRVKNGKIILPANQSYIFINKDIPKIGNKIVHTKNSLGFRGEEIPHDFNDYLSIVVLGGSATECFYLSDNETWPHLLLEYLRKTHSKVWLNNAGLDGFSTFGINVLLNEYIIKIKPKYALFLISLNEIGKDSAGFYDKDKFFLENKSYSFISYIKENSEIYDYARTVFSILKNRNDRNIGHKAIDLTTLEHEKINEQRIKERIEEHKILYINEYQQRLMSIIKTCKENGIIPIFITQPSMFGEGIDRSTKVNLETVVFGKGETGIMYWKTLELYNDTVRKVAIDNDVPLIDLASLLPKDSQYFYDDTHFSIEGAKVASSLIFNRFEEILKNNLYQ